MKPIINSTNRISLNTNNHQASNQPELNYDLLEKVNKENFKDLRDNKSVKDDYDTICKNSIIPLPGFVDSDDDISSEMYTPHSDWIGPSGDAWIGK